MTKVIGIDGSKVEGLSEEHDVIAHIEKAATPILEQCKGLKIRNITIVVEANGYAPMCTVSSGESVIQTIGSLDFVKSALIKLVS